MLLNHTLGILFNPDREWDQIRQDQESMANVFLTHVPILALIPVISHYIGVTQVGWTIGGGDVTKLTAESAMTLSVITYFSIVAGVWVFGEFINWMAKTYGADEAGHRHLGTALAVYVSVPVFLVGFVGLYPDLWINAGAMLIAGAYMVYLLYEGIPILMQIDKDRAFLYASSAVCVGLVLLVSVRVGSVLIWAMGFGPVYAN